MKSLTRFFVGFSLLIVPNLVPHSFAKDRPIITSYRHSQGSGPVRVRGFQRKNGTYVKPHYRSGPDGVKSNNWSTKGNVNSYTGRPGTK